MKTISKSDARAKLKEAKENLDLELITQAEYDKLKEELKPIIMSVSDDAYDTKESKQETSVPSYHFEVSTPKKNTITSKFVVFGGTILILWLIRTLMPPTNTLSGSNLTNANSKVSSKTHTQESRTSKDSYSYTNKQIAPSKAKRLAENYIENNRLLHSHVGLDYYPNLSNPERGLFTFYTAVCYGSTNYDCDMETAYLITTNHGKSWELDF